MNRKHGSIHANMASDMTDSDLKEKQSMAGTTISRHVGEFVPLTTEHNMVCEVNKQ